MWRLKKILETLVYFYPFFILLIFQQVIKTQICAKLTQIVELSHRQFYSRVHTYYLLVNSCKYRYYAQYVSVFIRKQRDCNIVFFLL